MQSEADSSDALNRDSNTHFLKALEAYQLGDQAEAARHCRAVLEQNPQYAKALSLLAELRIAQYDVEGAIALSNRAAAAAPEDIFVLNTHAGLLNRCDKPNEALAAADEALALEPNFADALLNRSAALVSLYRFVEARKALELVVTLKPELQPAVHHNLALLHGAEGQYETARKFADRAAEECPDVREYAVNRHSLSLYTPSVTRADEQATATAVWNATPLSHNDLDSGKAPTPSFNRPLRIGYCSADFKSHPVAVFLLPVLQRYDPQKFHVTIYDVTPNRDHVTEIIRELADDYHSGLEQSDTELAQKIAADQIDILIDLTGLFEGNRLNVFRYKPAPIQMSWIGYSGTTGVPEMDYVIADDYVCPVGCEADFSERIIRLPQHYMCYDLPDIAVTAQNPYARPQAGITFGNFNNHKKLNSRVIQLWAEILKRVPNASLFLKAPGFDNADLRRHVRRQFEGRGIPSHRLKISGRVTPEAHMNAYNDIDIALDPFPYCGTTTTVEALTMGVPVVTLVGDRWLQRTSYGFLEGMGWGALCAKTEKEYVEIAVGLAQDTARLRSMKASGRTTFAASPLCDSDRFTRELESAFLNVWQKHCERTQA